jgi:hypothetical protein
MPSRALTQFEPDRAPRFEPFVARIAWARVGEALSPLPHDLVELLSEPIRGWRC